MWRKQEQRDEVVPIGAGTCLTIPLGKRFQFRSFGPEPLAAVGVTMPPWPGDDEAEVVEGRWEPTLPEGNRVGGRTAANRSVHNHETTFHQRPVGDLRIARRADLRSGRPGAFGARRSGSPEVRRGADVLRKRNARDYAITTPNGSTRRSTSRSAASSNGSQSAATIDTTRCFYFSTADPATPPTHGATPGFGTWLNYFTVVQWDQRGSARTLGKNGRLARRDNQRRSHGPRTASSWPKLPARIVSKRTR